MTAMTTTGQPGAQRPRLGIVLKLWLGYVALAGLWVAYRYFMTIQDLVDHSDPLWDGDLRWALPALLGLSLANVLGAGLVLLRFKLGVWLILLDAAASLVIVLMLSAPITALLPGVVGLVVLLALVRLNWDAMR